MDFSVHLASKKSKIELTFGSAGGNLCVGKYEKLNPFPVSEFVERLVAT